MKTVSELTARIEALRVSIAADREELKLLVGQREKIETEGAMAARVAAMSDTERAQLSQALQAAGVESQEAIGDLGE